MTQPIHTHEVHVVANGTRIPGWLEYTISLDMLQPADAFSLRVKFSADAWALLPTDQAVGVYLDSTPILTGYVDTRAKTSDPTGGTMIEITGRDRTGRLVDESAPLFRYGGLRIKDLCEKICGIKDDSDPLFERVVLANTRNRSLLRNVRSRRAKVVQEPIIDNILGNFRPIARLAGVTIPTVAGGPTVTRRIARPPAIDPGIFQGRSRPRKVAPGSSRWSVLELFLREARLLAWSTGDGRELFVGLPNYDQQNQFYFFEAAGGSDNRDQTNAQIEYRESVAERYSRIVCVGAARASKTSHGKNVTRLRGVVFDNPEDTTDGVGISFRRRKALTITDDSVKTTQDALERAEREQIERDATAVEVAVDVPGHSQIYSGETPTIYAVDTMARIEDGDTGVRGDYLITAVEFSHSRTAGTRTRLQCVPRGTLLQL